MLSMKKRLFGLSFTLVLLVILTALFTSTVSAASVKSTSRAAGAGQHPTLVTAKNFQQFFPHAHIFQAKLGHDTVSCSFSSLQSYQNSHFVSTEISYSGSWYAMLRARASQLGPWEKYTLCVDDVTGLMTIQANANGLFVSAELGYTGSSYAMLRARASSVGPWEQYFLYCGFPTCVIQSKANGLYVAEEDLYWGNGYGMLRARTAPQNLNTWEEFIINPA